MKIASITRVVFVLVASALLGIILAVLFNSLGLGGTASSVLTGTICGVAAAAVVPYLFRKKS